jgi:hypothetical protein
METVMIADKDFQELIARRAQRLLALASYLSRCESSKEVLTRPFLGELLSQSTQVEELLDAYGARTSCRWCAFRLLTAAIKLFSDLGYELLHIQHVLPAYHLFPIERDFVRATEEALGFTGDVILRAAGQMLVMAGQLGLPVPSENTEDRPYAEHLPLGLLPHECGARRTEMVSETVTLLATAFLNLAAESTEVCSASSAKPEQYAAYASDQVSEEKLRSLEFRFHNLQSLYDTYVSDTDVEKLDADLSVLRGHITVVFHLLKTATLLSHYYERHVNKQPCGSAGWQEPVVSAEALLGRLMNYSIVHINLYIRSAERLCRDMLKRYVEVGEIEVPAPRYRGFHVRPCTLIAKLVLHYGSDVQMRLDDETYDADAPLQLFRANEKINAQKRRWLAVEIVRLKLVDEGTRTRKGNISDIVRDIVMALVKQSKLILYEQPLQLPEEPARKEGTVLEQVTDEIGRLLALGQIDVDTDLMVTFVGDKRVLADIKLLAESGYGEDKLGNNVLLPEKLAYLRR